MGTSKKMVESLGGLAMVAKQEECGGQLVAMCGVGRYI